MWHNFLCALVVLSLLGLGSHSAEAYVGPGAGITAIGTVIALLAAVFLAIVGFVWYPIKRLRAKHKKPGKTEEGQSSP